MVAHKIEQGVKYGFGTDNTNFSVLGYENKLDGLKLCHE